MYKKIGIDGLKELVDDGINFANSLELNEEQIKLFRKFIASLSNYICITSIDINRNDRRLK